MSGVLSLIRWLGPWEKDGVPRSVSRRSETLGAMRAHVYSPAKPHGAYVIAPGLHFLGPDDPRLDRFCRILAASGVYVVAPFLRDHTDLRVSARSADDLAEAFDFTERLSPRPAIFSISFGSQPAIALAARDSHRDRVGALVLFGGFADFAASVRFCLTGRAEYQGAELSIPHDPLNAPVVWMHLLTLTTLACDRDAVMRAWRTMVERTWGKMELKAKGARDPIAHEIAAELKAQDRAVFLLGCGLGEASVNPGEHLERALERVNELYAFTDPRADLARVRAPVAIVHGRDDDVIPWFEAEKLRDLAPRARVMITGLYGHTGAASVSPRVLVRELATMIGVVRTLAAAPRGDFST